MADYLAYQEGRLEIALNGLPSTCWFLLSTKTCDQHVDSETLAAANLGEIQGATGYTRKSQPKPAASGNQIPFALMTWDTGTATDWPVNVCSIVLVTSQDNSGKAICAWNLQTGGAPRDMSAAGTKENAKPTLTMG